MEAQQRLDAVDVERWVAAIGGAALAAFGIQKRSVAGAMVAAGGGALIYHGATGHSMRLARQDGAKRALAGARGVNVEQAVTINRPAEELYRYWRNMENLPRFLAHVIAIRPLDGRRSHWVVKGPAGTRVEWDAEIINEIPNELIGWRTLDGADVISAGSVRFVSDNPDRGTRVHVRLQYDPPAGKLGAAFAWVLGEEPSQTIREDLRRFKSLLEAGEILTTEGQPRGR